MKKIILFSFFALLLASCGSSRKTISKTTKTPKTTKRVTVNKTSEKRIPKKKTTEETLNNTSNKVIMHAKTFEGTRYKFGGATKKGIDCSGLVYVTFKKEGISMPRVSRDMANKGKNISVDNVIKGDLLFFKTNKKKTINHVGLVIENKRGEIIFIHSTTSRGVIISSLSENYWNKAFTKARRIIN